MNSGHKSSLGKRLYPLSQLFIARLREFYREPEAIFWVYGFPLILTIGLGIAFASRKPPSAIIDIEQPAVTGVSQEDATKLKNYLKDRDIVAEVMSPEDCWQRYRTGKTDLIVVYQGPNDFEYLYDETRMESVRARFETDAAIKSLHATGVETKPKFKQESGNRYIDFLLPGIMGLNLMGGGLFGVGFIIVDMRVRKLLKRLLATPMRRSDFLISVLGSRLVLLLPEMVVLLLIGWLVFGVPMPGTFWTMAIIVAVGATAFAGIGLVLASRTEKTETISGLINAVMLPMWLLSGTFFSSKRFPDVTQPFIQALPLTQINDALREVMLEGASLDRVAWRIGILAAWAFVSFAVALKLFKWQ